MNVESMNLDLIPIPVFSLKKKVTIETFSWLCVKNQIDTQISKGCYRVPLA